MGLRAGSRGSRSAEGCRAAVVTQFEICPPICSATNSVLPLVHNQLAYDKPFSSVFCQHHQPMEFSRWEFLVVWASLTNDFGERLYDRHIRPREPHGHLARAALGAGTELWAGKQVRQKFSDIGAATPTYTEGISPVGVVSVSTAHAAGIEISKSRDISLDH